MAQPRDVLLAALPRGLRWTATLFLLVLVLRLTARRWIAAGKGCDCELEVLSGARSDGQSAP